MVSVKRPEVANRIHDAKEHGDLSENAEYEDAKNEQAFVEGRIQTLEALIKNATIIDENHSTDHVQIGSTVAVESPDGKESLHDRRVGRGQARRGPDLEREPCRPRPARQEEGREGRREGPGRRLHLQDRRHQLGPRRGAWTGRTNSRPGSAARRSSTIRRRRRGRSTSAACAARSSSTSSPARCAPTGLETTLLYGVDDMDPMDAQALLTPDAIETEMGRPLAHVPDQAGDGHASLRAAPRAGLHRRLRPARHPSRSLLLDERHLPDRGDGPVHPARPRPGRARARDLPPRRQCPAPRDVASGRCRLPHLRQGRDDDRDRLGW